MPIRLRQTPTTYRIASQIFFAAAITHFRTNGPSVAQADTVSAFDISQSKNILTAGRLYSCGV